MTLFDDAKIRRFVGLTRSDPIQELRESDTQWHLDTFSILKRDAAWNNGWSFGLTPDARLYKRWFDAPEHQKKGWAIIFRIADPEHSPNGDHETFPGWVPPEREADADRWIEFLNNIIRRHLDRKGVTP